MLDTFTLGKGNLTTAFQCLTLIVGHVDSAAGLH